MPQPETKANQLAKGVDAKSKMNGLETKYAQLLQVEQFKGNVLWWKHHPFNLRLSGMKCFYAIDFCVIRSNLQVEFVETKGFMRDDAFVKFKVASEQFPHFIFTLVTLKDGEFVYRRAQAGEWL